MLDATFSEYLECLLYFLATRRHNCYISSVDVNDAIWADITSAHNGTLKSSSTSRKTSASSVSQQPLDGPTESFSQQSFVIVNITTASVATTTEGVAPPVTGTSSAVYDTSDARIMFDGTSPTLPTSQTTLTSMYVLCKVWPWQVRQRWTASVQSNAYINGRN